MVNGENPTAQSISREGEESAASAGALEAWSRPTIREFGSLEETHAGGGTSTNDGAGGYNS
jgi:hypothetical protein